MLLIITVTVTVNDAILCNSASSNCTPQACPVSCALSIHLDYVDEFL